MASALTLSDGAFIIGGQALNIWAERYYAKADELAYYGPYTSKDIDYFGQAAAARKLAELIDGIVLIPGPNDHTPESAKVQATIDGHLVEIDFLTHVLGVPDDRLQKSAADLVFQIQTPAGIAELKVPIMHPFHCLRSRIANVIELKRSDDVAKRQLEAAPIILREYISEMLDAGRERDATNTLQALFDYLRSDLIGRKAHTAMKNDPAAIIDQFADDARIERRYRENNLATMRRTIAERRTAWGKFKALFDAT